jgi:flagellar biosynthesis component FlhA
MVMNLNSIGNVLLDLHHTQVSIKSLEQTLQQLAPSIYELRKIYRLRETYEASLKEIVRRQVYAKKVGSLLQSHKQMAKKLQTDEIDQRLTFSVLHSEFLLSQLVPFLMKTEEEHRKLPVMEISNRRGLFLD